MAQTLLKRVFLVASLLSVYGLQISFGLTNQGLPDQTLSKKTSDNSIECGPVPRCRLDGVCTIYCKCKGLGTIGKCVQNVCQCDN
ncbi:hypothetical protein Hanom_Chr17g01573511 [Helianthus anomalus]